MTEPASLVSTISYHGAKGSTSWEGRAISDAAPFKGFLREVVTPRVTDAESSFEADLRALATTGMATEHVGRVLRSTPTPISWEVGEAIAECALQHGWGRDIVWPWNMLRDRRSPRASLPGADLVGFHRDGGAVLLLLGEVKTSSDAGAPPAVMHGRSGLAWQLEANALNFAIHLAILKWLHARCLTEPLRALYQAAVDGYLASSGKALLMVGVLVRDTAPNELDLSGRGASLAEQIPAPTRVELVAWYLPVAIAKLPELMKGDVS